METQETTAPVLPEPPQEGSRMKTLKRVLLGVVPLALLALGGAAGVYSPESMGGVVTLYLTENTATADIPEHNAILPPPLEVVAPPSAGVTDAEPLPHIDSPLSENTINLTVKDGIVTASFHDVTLAKVLDALKQHTGLEIVISSLSIGNQQVTRDLVVLSVEAFIRDLVGAHYVFVYDSDHIDRQLEKVILLSGGISLVAKDDVFRKFSLTYGNGDEQIGRLSGREGVFGGPNSFAIDADGNIVICDTVNRRLQFYDKEGKLVRSFPLGDIVPDDIVTLDNGGLLVFDATGKLLHLDKSGQILDVIPIDQSRWDSRGPMRIVGDSVYVRGSGQGDVKIATVVDGHLSPLTPAELATLLEDTYVGLGGAEYRIGVDLEQTTGYVHISHRYGDEERVSPVPIENVLSVEFLGDNQNGHFFLKTESDENGGIVLRVLEFDNQSGFVRSVKIPDSKYDLWAIRQVVVSESGAIVAMAPGATNVQVYSSN